MVRAEAGRSTATARHGLTAVIAGVTGMAIAGMTLGADAIAPRATAAQAQIPQRAVPQQQQRPAEPPAPTAPPAEQVAAATRAVIRQLNLQTDLPRHRQEQRIALPPEILWLVVGVALPVLAYALRDLIPFLGARHRRWSPDDHDTAAAAGAARRGEMVLQAADELAAQGRYVEAMHVLLLQALADMRARLDAQFADSLTSREILRRTSLRDDARAALRDVIARVEWTYFGEHTAARDDYLACRTSFNALAHALHRNIAA